jgi:ribosomal protein L32
VKRFQPRQNLSECAVCGSPKLLHHLCPHCTRKTLGKDKPAAPTPAESA